MQCLAIRTLYFRFHRTSLFLQDMAAPKTDKQETKGPSPVALTYMVAYNVVQVMG